MDQGPELGKLITDGDRRRDAVHIALAPVTAAEALRPGEPVGFTQVGSFEFVGTATQETIGIVDPFLTQRVEAGERFWLMLYPNSITGLRHIWSHPAFQAVAAAVRETMP